MELAIIAKAYRILSNSGAKKISADLQQMVG
jgi:hypothetical protein